MDHLTVGTDDSTLEMDGEALRIVDRAGRREVLPWGELAAARHDVGRDGVALVDRSGATRAGIPLREPWSAEVLDWIAEHAAWEAAGPDRVTYTTRRPPVTLLLPIVAVLVAAFALGPGHNPGAAAMMAVVFAGGAWLAARAPLAVTVDDDGLRVRRLLREERWDWSRVRSCRVVLRTGSRDAWTQLDAEVETADGARGFVPPGAPLLPLVGAIRRRIGARAGAGVRVAGTPAANAHRA